MISFRVLQQGDMPLLPNGVWRSNVEHACTSVLIWPAGQRPGPGNSVLTDPCLTPRSMAMAKKLLRDLDTSLADVGHIWETHSHADHMLNVPELESRLRCWPLVAHSAPPFDGLAGVACPGHSPDQIALIFRSGADKVWIAGDAVLNKLWLREWGYYWPNGYSDLEIVSTWETVAMILSDADIIVPGHGPPIRVTSKLIEILLDRFPTAQHANLCPHVADSLHCTLLKRVVAGPLKLTTQRMKSSVT